MALTKVTGQVIKNTTDVTVGVLTVTNTLAVGGTVSIGGTLTYEDVTNVDAVGLVTARNGIVVGSGITLSKDGDGFFTGVTTSTTFVGALTGNVTGNISGGTVAGSTGTFTGDFSIADKIVHTGDTNTALRFPAADTVTVETAGSEAIRITSDRDLGVGMGSPWARLVVHETSTNTDLTAHNYLASQSGMSIENGSTTDGCFSAYSARVKNNAGTQQSGSLAFKSTSSGYTPEIHLTQRTGAGVQATRLLIDSSGDILIGHSSNITASQQNKRLQIHGANFADSSAFFARYSADGNGACLSLGHSRNATVGSQTIVQDGDEVGKIRFYGSDGNNFDNFCAEIRAQIDGTPGSDDMPGRLVFQTTADGAASPTERLRIDSSGRVLIGTTTEGFATYGDKFTIADSGHCGMTIRSGTSSYGTIYFSDGDDGSSDEVRGFVDYNHSNNQLQIGTNAATRLRIDSSGNVTKPNTPFFSVYGSSSNVTYNEGDEIDFENATHNVGSHFKMTSGTGQYKRFIAPVAGVYIFTFGFFPNAASNCRISLAVNGAVQTNPYISGCFTAWGSGVSVPMGSQMLKLSANDYVTVVVQIGTLTNTYDGHTGFQGYLLG